ncbi:MAG: hypothetical protein SNJ61_09970, partial [Fimbriimonadaceae bacterium]
MPRTVGTFGRRLALGPFFADGGERAAEPLRDHFQASPGLDVRHRLLGHGAHTRALLADALSYVGEQGGLYHMSFGRGNKVGALLRWADGTPLSMEELGEFLQFARDRRTQGGKKKDDGTFSGATLLELEDGQFHFVGGLTEKSYNQLETAFEAWLKTKGKDGRIKHVKHEATYYEHD